MLENKGQEVAKERQERQRVRKPLKTKCLLENTQSTEGKPKLWSRSRCEIQQRYASAPGASRCSRLTITAGVRQANWPEGPFRGRWARFKTLLRIQTARASETEAGRGAREETHLRRERPGPLNERELWKGYLWKRFRRDGEFGSRALVNRTEVRRVGNRPSRLNKGWNSSRLLP